MQSYAPEIKEACSACDRACLHSFNCASRLIKPPSPREGLGVGFWVLGWVSVCWWWVSGGWEWVSGALSLTLQSYEKILKLPNRKHEKNAHSGTKTALSGPCDIFLENVEVQRCLGDFRHLFQGHKNHHCITVSQYHSFIMRHIFVRTPRKSQKL